jgi:NADPH-dependent 2,4-dienoyl-CoA reductase/sulfur reductase-like enzyme
VGQAVAGLVQTDSASQAAPAQDTATLPLNHVEIDASAAHRHRTYALSAEQALQALPAEWPSTHLAEGRPVVAVVGAGVAGLAAASHLQRAGIAAVVLEGRPRIGGRIFSYSCPTGEGPPTDPVNLGANYLHGCDPQGGNPVFNLADTFQLRLDSRERVHDSV